MLDKKQRSCFPEPKNQKIKKRILDQSLWKDQILSYLSIGIVSSSIEDILYLLTCIHFQLWNRINDFKIKTLYPLFFGKINIFS